MKQDVGDRPLVLVAEDVGGRPPLRFHPHVDGSVESQREAARRLIELHRRNPDIEHNPIGSLDAEALCDHIELAEAGFRELKAAAGRSCESGAGANRRWVAVDRDHPRAAIEKGARITPGAERGIDVNVPPRGA